MIFCKDCGNDWEIYGNSYERDSNKKIDYYCSFCGSKKCPNKIEPNNTEFNIENSETEVDSQEKILKKEKDKNLEITLSTDKIRTVQDLIRLSDIDCSVWELDRFSANSWESGDKYNYQIKGFWKKKNPSITSLEQSIKNIKPCVHISLEKRRRNGLLHEICIFDHHFGKYAWGQETGENYDLDIAKKRFVEAVSELSLYETSPEKILFPIGNDILHINTDSNMTYKGTIQDVDTRLVKVFRFAFESIVDSIYTLSKIAPVDVLWVGSNHDLESSYYLCFAIAQYFKNNENISVDISPKVRKCYTWGKNTIFFDHGEIKPEKLIQILSSEFSNEWCSAKYREVHAGHLHKKQEISFLTGDSFGSILYRRIPSLSGTDAWHYRNGFVGSNKAAQSFLWHKEDGQIACYQHNLRN